MPLHNSIALKFMSSTKSVNPFTLPLSELLDISRLLWFFA